MMAGLQKTILDILGGEIVRETKNFAGELDREWILLILEAKRLGIKKEEVRHFLKQEEMSCRTI